MKKIQLTLGILFCALFSSAQTVILEKDLSTNDTTEISMTQEKKHSVATYLGLGNSLAGADKGAAITFFGSSVFKIGLMYNYAFAKSISTGVTLDYTGYSYGLKQETGKGIPDSVLHDKEHINLNTIDGGVYMRFGFGKKELKSSIDIGMNAFYIVGSNHSTKDKFGDSNVEVIISRLPYIENWQTAANIRYNLHGFALNLNYRFTDQFTASYEYPELARLNFCITINLGD